MSDDLIRWIGRLERRLGVTRSSAPEERPVGGRVLLISQGPGLTRTAAVADYVARASDPAMLGPGADVTRPETWYPDDDRRPEIVVLIHDIPSAERPARGTARVISLDNGKARTPNGVVE
jgi:hypothetical protein